MLTYKTAFADHKTRSAARPHPAIAGLAVACALACPAGSANAQAVKLDTITVEAERAKDAQTEGSGSYATDITTAGSKTPTEIRDIPQTVTVVTKQQMEDQNLNSLERALDWTPGVTVATGDLFSGSFYARGHEIFKYSVDGAVRPLLSLYGTAPDLSFFDRIEVLSGPSTLFGGSGEPSAIINLGRKRARKELAFQGAALAGTDRLYRGEADVTGAVNESGSLRGRAVAFIESSESFVDVVDQKKRGVYGTTEFDLTESTTLSVGSLYEKSEVTRFSGLPAFTDGELLDVPRSTYIGADFNDFDRDAIDAFAEIEHRFDFGGLVRAHGRYWTLDADNLSVLPISGVDRATGDFDVFLFARDFNEDDYWIDGSFTQPFHLVGLKSEVTAGADYRRSRQKMRQQFVFGFPTQNIANPDSNLPEPDVTFPGVGPGFNLNSETTIEEYGGFVQGKVELIDGLTAILGGRLSYFDTKVRDTGRGTSNANHVDDEFTPYAGLTYDITETLTAYASYTEIFQPQDGVTIDASSLEPREGTQYEVGLKGSFLNGMLNAQAAVYYLKDEDRAIDDPDNVGFQINAGEVETVGFEAQVAGKPLPEVDLIASYAYTDTEIEEDPTEEFGEITPEHAFALWTKYSILTGGFRGLSFGAGVRAFSSIFSVSNGIRIRADEYAVVDAQIGYAITPNFMATLTVGNLFDKTYYQRVNEVSRGNFYGEPRFAILKVSAKF